MLGCEVFVPDEDNFPDAVSAPLEELLLLHAHADCHECWLGVWRGWGGHAGRYDNHVPQPTWCLEDEHGQGRWDLFRAPLRLAFAPLASDHTANLVWADDGSWWLNKGIDLHATYIGGSAALIDAVLQSDALEAWPAELDDDVTSVGDRLNGRPGRRRLGRCDHGKPWTLGFRAWRPPGDSRSSARSAQRRSEYERACTCSGRSVGEAQAVSVMARHGAQRTLSSLLVAPMLFDELGRGGADRVERSDGGADAEGDVAGLAGKPQDGRTSSAPSAKAALTSQEQLRGRPSTTVISEASPNSQPKGPPELLDDPAESCGSR